MCIYDKAQISHEILAYLSKHPDAKDTLEGVVEWWLLEQQITRRTADVREAISELVNRGLLIQSKSKGAPTFFRINKRRADEISDLLKQGWPGAHG
jgi:hypothetical protein